jgi:hypothetical protein
MYVDIAYVDQKKTHDILRANQREELCSSESSATESSRKNSHIFWFLKDMNVYKYFLERSWSLVSNASKANLIKSTNKVADLYMISRSTVCLMTKFQH